MNAINSAPQRRKDLRPPVDPVIIVGAGLAALRTAEALRSAGYSERLVVVGDEPHLPYNRPPLSKEALSGGINVDDLLFRRRAAVEDVEWRVNSPVHGCDLDARTVNLRDGSVERFSGLVIACGIRPRVLPIPGPALGRTHLRTANDAQRLRASLQPGAHLVILGAGFIGCEVAATARSLGAEVDVVALDEQPLIRPLGSMLGATIRERHESQGVRFHLGRTVTEVLGADHVTGVRLDDGTELPATVVLEAVGSVPNIEWLTGTPLDLTDGVLVDGHLRAIGTEAPVFAVGDVACHPNALFPGHTWRIEHWNMPTEMGRHAGRSLAASLAGREPETEEFSALPSFWSDQFEVNIQSFGMPALGIAELVDGQWESDCIVAYHDESGLVGVIGVNRTKDLGTYRNELLSRQQPA